MSLVGHVTVKDCNVALLMDPDPLSSQQSRLADVRPDRSRSTMPASRDLRLHVECNRGPCMGDGSTLATGTVGLHCGSFTAKSAATERLLSGAPKPMPVPGLHLAVIFSSTFDRSGLDAKSASGSVGGPRRFFGVNWAWSHEADLRRHHYGGADRDDSGLVEVIAAQRSAAGGRYVM